MANWFIMAAGEAKRCGGDIKQLYEINGEPIIHRTIRLIRSIDPTPYIYIISWRMELCIEGCKFINTLFPTESLAESCTYIHPYIGVHNIILCGDTIFTKDIIQDIYNDMSSIMVYGKIRCDIGNIPERYALTFHGSEANNILAGYNRCVDDIHPYRNDIPCAILPEWAYRLSTLHNRHGIIGYIYWRTLVFLIAMSTPMKIVTDPYVVDIDSQDELILYKQRNNIV